jgi:hypothetical protein
MQDTQVGFDLMGEYHLPLAHKILILYLLVILILAVITSVRLGWHLCRVRGIVRLKSSKASPAELTRNAVLSYLDLAPIRIASLRKASVLTFLLSLLVSVYTAIERLRDLSIERQIGLGILGAEGAELLIPLALGIAVCAFIYTLYWFFDATFARLKAALDCQAELVATDGAKKLDLTAS